MQTPPRTPQAPEYDLAPLIQALRNQSFTGKCVDVDLRRVRGGLGLETDYIIDVQLSKGNSFRISKTYRQFRTLGEDLKALADLYTGCKGLPPTAAKAIKFCDQVHHIIHAQQKSYIGKVNYMYAKVLANDRRTKIDAVWQALRHLPADDSYDFLRQVLMSLDHFLMSDRVVESDNDIEYPRTPSHPLASWLPSPFPKQPDGSTNSYSTATPPPAPLSTKRRRSVVERQNDIRDLQNMGDSARLLLESEVAESPVVLPNYQAPTPVTASGGTRLGDVIQNNPSAFSFIALVALYVLRRAADSTIAVDADIFLLLIFASFCLGLHTPRGTLGGFDRPATMKGTVLLPSAGVSVVTTDDNNRGSGRTRPMQQFPEAATIGSHTNCWSKPVHTSFRVRGPKYLRDRVKIPSEDFLFPIRRVELFLTDVCPSKVGRNPDILDGKLRYKPTFLINFILPWGVLLFYFEIPDRFLPFLRAMNNPEAVKALPPLDQMSAADRTVSRWLMNDDDYKNKRIKIVPVVVDGPWVVRQVCGGKPAIVGTKMPISYHFEPGNEKEQPYFEADLDIAASSAARGILSVARSYTNVLTLNLGFVIEGQTEDELPERMMVGCCLHGIDPPSSPHLPPMDGLLDVADDDGESSLTAS